MHQLRQYGEWDINGKNKEKNTDSTKFVLPQILCIYFCFYAFIGDCATDSV